MSFESLEDNFFKKVNEPVKTDVEMKADAQKKLSETNAEDKETYEENLTKKQVIGGLAALFQEKIKEKSDTGTDDTIFISTENLKYGDKFVDATNYVSERDIQKFMPGDVYNDSIKEPQLEPDQINFDQRHSPANKYDDKLSFEPQIASESDIGQNTSISRSVNADAPYSDDEIANKLAAHNDKKNKKQFSENIWSPNNSGPNFGEGKSEPSDSEVIQNETELTREEYERNLKELQDNSTNSE